MPFRACLRTLLSLLFALQVWGVNAAEVAGLPYWHTSMVHMAWTRRDGAPSSVYNMTQDERGMLWFAANDGVYRFDGARFEHLTSIDGNGLHSSSTSAIMVMGTALWVGYNFGGISMFDKGKVRHYGAADGLSARTVHRLGRTRDGTIWAGTVDGLFWLDGQRWHLVTEQEGMPAGRILCFVALPDGGLEVSQPAGVFRGAPGSRQFRRVAKGESIEIQQPLPNGDTLLVDQRRRYSRYTANDDRLTPLIFPTGVQPVEPFLDMHGALWINPEEGLTLLGPDLRPRRVFSGLDNLSGKQIFATFDDREGNLWVTTENGVDRLRESRLTTIALPNRMRRMLSVQSGRDGTVWIGNHTTKEDHLEVESFGLQPDGQRIAAPAHDVSATTRAPDGSLWFGNAETLWQNAGGHWRSWPLPADLRGNDVQALAMDGSGRLWVSVVHNGVHVFQDGRWVAGGGNAALAKRTAVSLFADTQGKVWFGYPDSRLAVLDGENLREYGSADGLKVGNVTVMASRNGALWVGGDQGVAVLEGQRFAALLDDAGKPLSGVYGMVANAGGAMWLHGIDGLTRIANADLAAGLVSGHRMRVERFDYLDGLDGKPAPIRPLPTLTETPDGRLWYATESSIGWIDPAHIPRNPHAPTVQVTALRTDQSEFDARPGLVLPQHTRNLELVYTAATLSIPERVRFRYRLLGMDDAWRDAGTRRNIFYTNLGPGDYRFEVLAANEDGVWSVTPAVLSFRIEAAFIQTIWFKLLCALLVLAAAALFYWRRMALLTLRINERLRERLRERERIARALHDNFLQSVQALMMQFNRVKLRLPPGDAMLPEIDASLRSAEDVLSEGREQVLALRIKHELTGDLDTALAGLGHILAPRHGARFSMQVTGVARPMRAMAASEAYAIAREALLNAFRHARSDEVTLELRHSGAQFVLQVRDQGRGMDADVHARGQRPGHFGLTGMRERAGEIGGTLDIRSTAGRGTKVTLRLPARQAYARKASDKVGTVQG